MLSSPCKHLRNTLLLLLLVGSSQLGYGQSKTTPPAYQVSEGVRYGSTSVEATLPTDRKEALAREKALAQQEKAELKARRKGIKVEELTQQTKKPAKSSKRASKRAKIDSTEQRTDSLTLQSDSTAMGGESTALGSENLAHSSESTTIKGESLPTGSDSTTLHTSSLSAGTSLDESAGALTTPLISGSLSPSDSLIGLTTRPLSDSLVADTAHNERYSKLFRDTIPLSRMTAISLVVPGFSQLYNKQAWKIPILYGVTGGLTYLAIQQGKQYKSYRTTYNALEASGAPQEQIDAAHSQMIQKNTVRQVLIGGAIASYIYFLGDGVMNYKGGSSNVKKATTLSTLLPGAGQIYNKSYWKVPIIVGGFATLGYIVDYNVRGYNRYNKAYQLVSDGDDSTVDEFNGMYSAENLESLKNSYRRNRDLSIFGLVALYMLNIVDAHVEAHFKDYDVSDDMAMSIQPTVINLCTHTESVNAVGMSVALKF